MTHNVQVFQVDSPNYPGDESAVFKDVETGILTIDKNRNISFVNHVFCTIFGKKHYDLIGLNICILLKKFNGNAMKTWTELDKSASRNPGFYCAEFKVFIDNIEKRFEVKVLSPNSPDSDNITTFWKDTTFFENEKKIPEQNNFLKRLVVEKEYVIEELIEDLRLITNKKNEGDSKLDLFFTALEKISDNIIISDSFGRILYVNNSFEKLTSFRRNELIGENVEILISDRNRTGLYKEIRKSIRKNKSWSGNLVSRKKDGSYYEEESIISPIMIDENENISYIIAITRDVTEKKRLESIAEAANLMDNMGFVFSGIRHEIGNPVNSIKMALTVLDKNLDTYSKDLISEFVQRSLEEVARVEYLLKSFRSFSMFEKPKLRDVRIDQFLDNFFRLIKSDFERRSIRIRIISDSVWCRTDQRALHQVLLNIFTNAADALEDSDDPKIFVTVKKAPNFVKIKIEDNGFGMSEAEMENLYKPFMTTKPHGTGLGLVIVKKMLSNMNSMIHIKSKKDVGTAVSVFVPEV